MKQEYHPHGSNVWWENIITMDVRKVEVEGVDCIGINDGQL
jgi:hypothetical protein